MKVNINIPISYNQIWWSLRYLHAEVENHTYLACHYIHVEWMVSVFNSHSNNLCIYNYTEWIDMMMIWDTYEENDIHFTNEHGFTEDIGSVFKLLFSCW